jgi:hypothetical protein
MSTIMSSQSAAAKRNGAHPGWKRRDTLSSPAIWPIPDQAAAHEPRGVARSATRALRPRGRALTPLLAFWLVVYTLLNVGDLMSTYAGLHAGLREANPLMSGLLAQNGFGALVAYKLVVIFAVVGGAAVLHRMHPRAAHITVGVCNTLVCSAVALNVWQMLLH